MTEFRPPQPRPKPLPLALDPRELSRRKLLNIPISGWRAPPPPPQPKPKQIPLDRKLLQIPISGWRAPPPPPRQHLTRN